VRTLVVAPGAPQVRLLDARAAGVGEPGLREWARDTDEDGELHVTRAYRFPYALAAWHSEPVGVDIERIEHLELDFLESICTPAERRWLSGRPYPYALLAWLWCSKEALAKALGHALSYDPRRLDSPVFWPGGRSGPWRGVPVPVPPGHSGWMCWRSSDAQDVV
jgi:hypothetical protein